MKYSIRRLLPSLLALLLLSTACGVFQSSERPFRVKYKDKSLPRPKGYVNDFEKILSSEQEAVLTALVKSHEKETSDQIAIVTVSTLEPYDNLDDLSLDLANYWGVGQEDKHNGVLIAIGRELRVVGIQNGFGIEKRLSDAETQRIISEVMIPQFKENQHYEGLKKGVEAIIAELK